VPPSALALNNARPTVLIDGQQSSQVSEQILSLEMTEKDGGLSSLELRLAETATVNRRGTALLFEDGRLVKLGAALRVCAGPQEAPVEIFQGVVTALELEFPEGASPTLLVLAEDCFQRARMARRTKLHEDTSISDLVTQVASQIGLTASVMNLSDNIGTQVQLNESDLAFLRRLIARYDGDLQVVGTELHAVRRADAARGRVALTAPGDLDRIRVIADLAHQATKMTIAGWDITQASAVTATSEGSTFGPGTGRKASEVLNDTLGSRVEHLSYLAVSNQTEAQAVAHAAFDERARRFVVADGTTREGHPDLRVGTTVALSGLGDRFSNDYYVTFARHRYDRLYGYKTDFSAQCAFLRGNR
jgi:phage protein D